MKTASRALFIASAVIISLGAASAPAAFAQDKMSHDTMKKDDAMSHDSMKKDGAMSHDAMKKDDAMSHDAMSHDAMKKDEAKK
jgi:pentapeptide MXKDX repeat protein